MKIEKDGNDCILIDCPKLSNFEISNVLTIWW
jgi:hypothetical protein